MARNVEIKAQVSSVGLMLEKAAAIADSGPTEIYQDDTFFFCPTGKLKLRRLSATDGALIFYQRPNGPAPKQSSYILVSTSTPDLLREILTLSSGQAGHVRKHRTLFLAGRTRIHLDRVEGLGDFLELEVGWDDGELTEVGVRVAYALLGRLGISGEQLVGCAYVDLLAAKETNSMRSGTIPVNPSRVSQERILVISNKNWQV